MANRPAATTRPSLTLKRRLAATPERVYAAWTQPEELARWFGPDSGEVLEADLDVRVGGRFHVAFLTEDGERHDVGGIYREVVPESKLVMTWAWRTTPERESLLSISLRADRDGTLLTLLHEQFFDETTRDNHRSGWQGALDKLERVAPAL